MKCYVIKDGEDTTFYSKLTIIRVLPQRSNLCNKRQVCLSGSRLQQDAITRTDNISLLVAHQRVAFP
jgi:hypothetical protein